jgi:putative pyruvate formate lyase activating enzyme
MVDYKSCTLCARECGLNRYKDITPCHSGASLKIAGYGLHFFEEPPISGTKGSGAVFFSGCSLSCRFCQNYEISRKSCGKTFDAAGLSRIFVGLEKEGAHNINIVNPTHFAPTLIEAVNIRKPGVPVIYNTHGYDNTETIKALEGFVDVYLPDIKYYKNEYALRYSSAKDYFEKALKAVKLMCSQVKTVFDADGLIKSGVIIRHLVLPGMSSDSIEILEAIKNELPEGITVSLMAQYTPCGDLSGYPEINRKITAREYERVVSRMETLNLNGYIQSADSSDKIYIPRWNCL